MPFYKGAAKQLSDFDFARLAKKFSIEEALIRAVNQVESRGRGYMNGMVVALYEPHIAYRYVSGNVRNEMIKAGLAYKTWVSGRYPKTSYARIDAASKIAGEEVAALSTSWGLGQVMGFNFRRAGYDSAVAMVKAFANSEGEQLEGMMNFIKSQPPMMEALKKKDFSTFAELYNGKGYKQNQYDTRLAKAYATWASNRPAGLIEVTVRTDDEEMYGEYTPRESIWAKMFRFMAKRLRRE